MQARVTQGYFVKVPTFHYGKAGQDVNTSNIRSQYPQCLWSYSRKDMCYSSRLPQLTCGFLDRAIESLPELS